MNILSIIRQCFLLCEAPLMCNNLLQAPGHGLNQVSEVLGVCHPGNPQLLDLFLQHLNVGTVDFLQLHLHPGPHILYRIQVRAVARPVYPQDVGPLPEPFCHNFRPVAGGPVLEEVRSAILVQEELQLLIQQPPLPFRVHNFTFIEKLQSTSSPPH